MLMPWRLDTAEGRSRVEAALPGFVGRVLLPAGLTETDSQALMRTLPGRIASEADATRDIWIASGRLEHPRSLLSLLHARVEGGQATVDLLLALAPAEGAAAAPYQGYGELTLLTLLLERRDVRRLHLALAVDPERSGLRSAGWVAGPDAVYERHPAPV